MTYEILNRQYLKVIIFAIRTFLLSSWCYIRKIKLSHLVLYIYSNIYIRKSNLNKIIRFHNSKMDSLADLLSIKINTSQDTGPMNNLSYF